MVFYPVGVRQHPADQLRRELNRLFTGAFGEQENPWGTAGQGRPAMNAWETTDAIHVEMEVPGINSDQMEISVVGGELTVKIDRADAEQPGVAYHRRERPVGSFTRVLRLPVEVDPNEVEAELRNGVLTVHLPKAEAAKPRKIQVTAVS